MKHMHHLKPRHLGGTDDPSNLLEVTPEEHALIHEARWYAYGHEYDRIAWLALSGQIGKDEALLLALKAPERGRKISEKLKGRKTPWLYPGCFSGRDTNGSKNPKAKKWLVTDPYGQQYKVHGNLQSFCKSKNIAAGLLRRFIGEEVPIPNAGGYGGIRYFTSNIRGSVDKVTRLNTVGWQLDIDNGG